MGMEDERRTGRANEVHAEDAEREPTRKPDREIETVRPLGTPTVATPGDVIRAQPDDAAAGAPRAAVLNDPALSRTSDTGVSDRSKDFGEPAPDGVRSTDDMLGEPQTNTGAFAGAVAGAVIGGAAGP